MTKNILESIARHVFPGLGAFSSDGHAELGEWDVWVSEKPGCAVLTVAYNQGVLFQIMASLGRVEAAYALPVENGEKGYGTEWARSRRWMDGWSDVPQISAEIREFFNNLD